MRGRTNLESLPEDIIRELKTIRTALRPVDGSDADEALCGIETFCAIALRIMAKTNSGKIRSEAKTYEIGMRIAAIELAGHSLAGQPKGNP